MPVNPEPVNLRIRQPSDFIPALPYLLGYHPADALCIVALSGIPLQLTYAASLRLPDSRDDLPGFTARVRTVLQRNTPACIIVVGYGPRHRVTPAVDAIRELEAAMQLPVVDALRVEDNRYWSYLDTSTSFPDGIPYDPYASPAAVTATVGGLTAQPSRKALAETIAPQRGTAAEAMRAATDRGRRWMFLLQAGAETSALARQRVRIEADRRLTNALDTYQRGDRLHNSDLARLSVLLRVMDNRDAALYTADTDRGNHERLTAHHGLWADMTRRAVIEVETPATLLAFTSWLDGNGAMAAIAVDRALSANPQYKLAILISSLLDSRFSPLNWRGLTALG